jgi:hypothetical protein
MAFRVGQIKKEYYKQQGFETTIFVEESELDTTYYNDITSPHVLANEAIRYRDYDFVRRAMLNDVEVVRSGFTNLDEIDKPYAAEYVAVYSAQTILDYYENDLSYSETGATAEYLNVKSQDFFNRKISYAARLRADEFRKILVKYLTLSDIEEMTFYQKVLFDKYEDEAILGKSYGDIETGIMDFITATNDYENQGLSLYNIISPYSWTELRDDLINLLVNGNYENEVE